MSKNWVEEVVSTVAGQKGLRQESVILDVTELICEIMDRENVSRATLAERMGCTKSRITQLLDGSANMTLRTLSDIFFALGSNFFITETLPDQCAHSIPCFGSMSAALNVWKVRDQAWNGGSESSDGCPILEMAG